MDYGRSELADRLAAEYVAGTLRGPARRRLEKLLPAHPALRDAVTGWQDRLMPLTGNIEPQQPSPGLWPRIEARVHGAPAAAAAARPGWWQGLAFWRGFSAIGLVATLSLALMLASPGPVQPPIVVVLAAAAPVPGAPAGAVQPGSIVASISADGRAMVTKPIANVSMGADRALELWSLPAQGAPRSLGLIAPDKATVVQRDKVLQGTDSFAVTLEQAGGSPDGTPHGPILYVGKLVL
ncbi:MAG TPA: anti-sigma factor [Burkholderiaceae bacterium]|jgi:anti-sigma-K factor RskA